MNKNYTDTKQHYKKFGWKLITIVLLLWIALTPSHFKKGGVKTEFYFFIAFFIALVSLLISFLFDGLHWLERIFISLLFSFISLFLTALIIVPQIVELLYDDKTWFLWETKNRIFINTIFYGLNTAVLIILSSVYLVIRGKIKKQQKVAMF